MDTIEITIINTLYKLEDIWHHVLELSGNFWLGHYLRSLIMTIITYKRVCDVCESETRRLKVDSFLENESDIEDYYTIAYEENAIIYKYSDENSWSTVAASDNKVAALEQAIRSLNESRLGVNGDSADEIPLFYCQNSDESYINGVLNKWFEELEKIDIGTDTLSDQDWLNLKYYLESKTKKTH